jgi:hypothetical protein
VSNLQPDEKNQTEPSADLSIDAVDTQSLKTQVFELLAKDPQLTVGKICRILDVSTKSRRKTVRQYVWLFKTSTFLGIPQGSPLPHKRVFVWEYVDRHLAGSGIPRGWVKIANRNGMWSYRDALCGGVHWHKNGVVRLYLRGAVQLARAKELFSRAFGWLTDEQLCKYLDLPLHETSRHWVFDVGVPLPRFDVRSFKRSHGIRVFSDRSHPNAVEIEETVPLGLSVRFDRMDEKFDYLLQGGSTSQQLLRANLGLLQAKVQEDREKSERGNGGENKFMTRTREGLHGPLGLWHFPVANALLQASNCLEKFWRERENEQARYDNG